MRNNLDETSVCGKNKNNEQLYIQIISNHFKCLWFKYLKFWQGSPMCHLQQIFFFSSFFLWFSILPCCCCIWPVGCVIALHELSDWTRAKHHSLFGAAASPQPPHRHWAPCLLATEAQSALKGAGHNWGHKTWEEKEPTGLAAIDLQQVKRWTGGEREEGKKRHCGYTAITCTETDSGVMWLSWKYRRRGWQKHLLTGGWIMGVYGMDG